MKLIKTIIACLCIPALVLLSSCFQGATCTIKEVDGLYYINFTDGNEPSEELYMSSVSSRIGFKSIAEMKQTYSGKEDIEIHKKGGLRCLYPKAEGKGIHFFNMDELLVPVLPKGFSEQLSGVSMECENSLIVYYAITHTLADNETVKAKTFFYHSMKDWNLHMERISARYLSSFGNGQGTSYEKEGTIKRFTIHDDLDSLQYVTYTANDSIRYIIEYAKDGITSVTMFVLEGDIFFSVQISGLTESPSVEYLQSFSAKVYED